MANLKTDESYFNKDNFVERDGKLQEIVVSITLEEYRGLVASKADLQRQVWDKNEKIRKLEEKIQMLDAAGEELRLEIAKLCEMLSAVECELEHERFGDMKGSDEDAEA